MYTQRNFLVALTETKRELVLFMAFFDQPPLPSNLEGQVNVLYMERPPLLDSLVFSASFLHKLLFVPSLSMATEKPTVQITQRSLRIWELRSLYIRRRITFPVNPNHYTRRRRQTGRP